MVDPSDFETAISTADQPYILRNFPLDWKLFDLSFGQWCKEMDEHEQSKKIEIAAGTTKHCDIPYWERHRTNERLQFAEIPQKFEEATSNDKWYSYNYKNINKLPTRLRRSISFDTLGFADVEEVFFGFGSKGAPTPCHYDKYGVNIIVQVYGKKSWLLFPPDTPFKETSIPYDGNGVYCKENLYSPSRPDRNTFNLLGQKVLKLTLNPGDILILPSKWWHYVENLETSLTISTRVPLGLKDKISLLKDAFVKLRIYHMTGDNHNYRTGTERIHALNPDERSKFNDPLNDVYKDFRSTAEQIIEQKKAGDPLESPVVKHYGQRNRDIDFEMVQPITLDEFKEIMKKNGTRYDISYNGRKVKDDRSKELENILNAVCHPESIEIVCEAYLKQIENDMKLNKIL